MRCVRASTSSPSHFASFALASNFDPPGLCTQTGQPQILRLVRSGGWPYSASNGVFPSRARVAVWFFSHDACRSASPHSDLGRPLSWANAQIRSRRVRFRRSAMPLSWGVSCVVSFLAVPAAARCALNAALRYSPPRSDLKTLIPLQ